MKLSRACESKVFFNDVRIRLMHSFGNLCEKNQASRLLAFPLCVADHSLAVTQAFANLSEHALKGCINVFAAPFVKKARILKGLAQLGAVLPKFIGLFFLPLYLIVDGLYLQTAFFFRGQKFTESREDKYRQSSSDATLSFLKLMKFQNLERKEMKVLDDNYKIKVKSIKDSYDLAQKKLTLDHAVKKQYFLAYPHLTSEIKAFNAQQALEKKSLRIQRKLELKQWEIERNEARKKLIKEQHSRRQLSLISTHSSSS